MKRSIVMLPSWPTRTEAKPTISKQYSRVEQSLLNPPVNPWIEALSHLRHYLRFVVELWPVGTKLRTRGTSISFPPRPLLASSFRHVCHVIEQGVVLVCRYSHSFHICWGSPGTSFWLKIFLHFLVTFVSERDIPFLKLWIHSFSVK